MQESRKLESQVGSQRTRAIRDLLKPLKIALQRTEYSLVIKELTRISQTSTLEAIQLNGQNKPNEVRIFNIRFGKRVKPKINSMIEAF